MKEILREIGMIARCCSTISDLEFKDINLAKGQYIYLVRIMENPGIIQERLATVVKVDRTTVAKAIKKLVNDGMVEKKKEDGNLKEWKLYCTEKGRNLYPILEEEEIDIVRVATSGLSEKEKKLMHNLLHKMRLNIEQEWEEKKKLHR